jgi:hypothetical protein
MPKHEAATWFEKADAETRSRHSIAETRALTVSSQGRHSQRAQLTWPNSP